MLQMEFNYIFQMKIYSLVFFIQNIIDRKPRGFEPFLTFFCVSNSRLIIFFHHDRPILTAAQFYTFSLFHFSKIDSNYFIVRTAQKSTSPSTVWQTAILQY